MTYKEIYYFTGQCLSLDENPSFRDEIISRIKSEDIDWEVFIQLCSDHLVIPAIYLRFKKYAILSSLPEELSQALTEIYLLNRERNTNILLQIEHITAALSLRKIFPVFLKGTANLLDGLYSDIGERMIHDIDFLVEQKDFLRTVSIFEAMGYNHKPDDWFDYKYLKHYPILFNAGEIAPVEIHQMPVDVRYSKHFNSAMVFSEKKEVPGKPGVYVPSDRHKLVHTFIHSQLADKGHTYKRSSFRGYTDLYLLSKRLDVSLLADQCGYRQKVVSWLVFGQRVLGVMDRFYPRESAGAQWYSWIYDLSLTHGRIYNAYTILKKLIYLFVVRYAGGFLKALFLQRERLSVYRRLTSREYYGAALLSYKDYFS